MAGINILLITIQCLAFVHQCTCSQQLMSRSAADYLAREFNRDRTSSHKHQVANEKSHPVVHHRRHRHLRIVRDPEQIFTIIPRQGINQLRNDYLHLFTNRGLRVFTGPAKEEFLQDCMRDVMHWIGKDTRTTPVQRMEFCQKFWKIQNSEADFADEIKHLPSPCSEEHTSHHSEVGENAERTQRPCHESSVSRGDEGYDEGSGTRSSVSVEEAAAGKEVQVGSATITEGETEGQVTAVGDASNAVSASHGDTRRGEYPETNGGIAQDSGPDSKSKFRPVEVKQRAGAQQMMQPFAVLVLVAALHL